MLVNLTDVFTSEGITEEKKIEIEMRSIRYLGVEFQIKEKTPLSLKFTNIAAGEALIKGTAVITLVLGCDRCLRDVPYTFSLSFDRTVKSPERASELSEEETDEQNYMEGYQLNTERLISSEILLDWPMKILCREDCGGICSKCGKDLNAGDCGCDTFVPDPRMAAIKDIFKANNKEV